MPTQLNHAILRATPDPRRGETVNIGIVIFLPDRADIRILPELRKLKALDPNIALDDIYQYPETINTVLSWAKTDEQRHQLLDGMGFVSASAMGYFTLHDPVTYEQQVEDILRDLVQPPTRQQRRTAPTTRIIRTLKEAFIREGVYGHTPDDIDQHRVVHNYPIAADERLFADFALKNGRWHITETIDLRGKPDTIRGDKYKQAAVKAITLERATKRLQDCLPMVVYAADDAALEQADYHLNLLSDSAERLFNILDPAELADYIDHIARAAGAGLQLDRKPPH